MKDEDLRAVSWRKSSYSGASNGDCVEVGVGVPSVVPVRDSKDPNGPALAFESSAWRAFVAGVKGGDFDA
ncbi:DUF397 domain-containing protein [Streptomyces sp. NPDC057702]|uniref:DUF397 domain-containing protein n=1 Tax=unclassified Streptomyces TaxID=2593676 RepID=UPI003681203F